MGNAQWLPRRRLSIQVADSRPENVMKVPPGFGEVWLNIKLGTFPLGPRVFKSSVKLGTFGFTQFWPDIKVGNFPSA